MLRRLTGIGLHIRAYLRKLVHPPSRATCSERRGCHIYITDCQPATATHLTNASYLLFPSHYADEPFSECSSYHIACIRGA